MKTRKVILFISMSLDGFIATSDDDLSWLDRMQVEGEDYGYQALIQQVDTYIVGRKTYSKVVDMLGKFPQQGQFDCYILTRQEIPSQPNLTFYQGNVADLIHKLRQKPGKHIYCDGGGEIVKLFMDHDLIDEYIISVIPTLLGEGKRLFRGGTAPRHIRLVDSKTYPSGLVQLKYVRERDASAK
ncbi:MAG: dihydrofolate reductase [Bacteroidia bacterium]|nr:dihydrofolate reductase [Bacteroidia bacterium]